MKSLKCGFWVQGSKGKFVIISCVFLEFKSYLCFGSNFQTPLCQGSTRPPLGSLEGLTGHRKAVLFVMTAYHSERTH